MSRNIDDLIPDARAAYIEGKEACRKQGLIIVETCVKRSLLEHIALYAQGREKYAEICKLRQAAGLWEIGEETAGRKVTWTFLSKHISEYTFPRGHRFYGLVLALDFALRHYVDQKSKLHWNIKVDVNDNEIPDYDEVGAIMVAHGFEAGKDWKSPDRPHIQWPYKEAGG